MNPISMLARVQKLISLNSKFSYDWNQSQTAKPNLALIPEIESFLREIPDNYTFDDLEHNKIYFQLLYRLSTFYLHYTRDHQKALKSITIAENLNKRLSFLNAEQAASLCNQLAYTYQIKMQQEGHQNDRDKVLAYCKQVIENKQKIQTEAYGKKVAYAKIVVAHTYRDNGEYAVAEKYYKTALAFYQSINAIDEQYIRLKNTLAQTVNAQEDKTEEAGKIFAEVSEYWNKIDHSQNHYAANHFFAYANYCYKNGNYSKAATLLNKVIDIYNRIHTNGHKDYFIFSDLPQLAQTVHGKLPEQEKSSYAALSAYVYHIKNSKRNYFEFWNKYRTPIVVGALVAASAIGIGTAMARQKK